MVHTVLRCVAKDRNVLRRLRHEKVAHRQLNITKISSLVLLNTNMSFNCPPSLLEPSGAVLCSLAWRDMWLVLLVQRGRRRLDDQYE